MIQINTDTIKALKGHSNLDAFYGPYFITESGTKINPDSEKYKEFVTFSELETYLNRYTKIGLTVGIIDADGTISEYWFLKDEDDEQLILTEKGVPTKLKLVHLTVTTGYSNGNYTVNLHYSSIGNVLLGVVTFYRDGVPLKSDDSNYKSTGGDYFISSETIGTHTYKVVITNLYGQSTEDETDPSNPVSIGILRILTTLSFNTLKRIKRVPENVIFDLDIELLSSDVKKVQVVDDANHPYLDVFSNLVLNLTTNVSFNLSSFDIGGKNLYLLALNSEDNILFTYDLFDVLDVNTLFIYSKKSNILFVEGHTIPVAFIFRSGATFITNLNTVEGSNFWLEKDSINLEIDDDGEIELSLKVIPLNISSGDKIENATINFLYTIDGNTETAPAINLGTINKYVLSERSISWSTFPLNGACNSCYIDFTSTGLYPTDALDGIIMKFNDKMWISNDVIHVNELEIATPLYETDPIYIGLGYGIYDTNPNIETLDADFRYDCICINGMIVKVSPYSTSRREYISEWNHTNAELESELFESLHIASDESDNLCRGIWWEIDTDLEPNPLSLYDDSQEKFLFEDNFEKDCNPRNSTPCATLTLTAITPTTQDLADFNSFMWSKGNLNTNVVFGSILDGYNKYAETVIGEPSNEDLISMDNISGETIKLFKISTKLKEKKYSTGKDMDVLKKWGVFCNYTYHKEGVPDKSGQVIVYTQGTSTLNYPIPNFRLNFKQNPDLLDGVDDLFLTAKADYMESAHLNNTPLAMLYNKVLKSSAWSGKEKSPALANDMYDAILGEPVIITIKDIGAENKVINLGSFMLNTDKKSPTMGLKLGNGIMSFEGHSNELDLTSSRFIYKSGESAETLDSDEKIIKFLKEGIEDRELKSNDESETEDALWLRFYNDYWKVINTNGDSIDPTTSNPIDDIVCLDYCYLYVIFLMIFGMTDNMGKNAMFDIWKQDGTWGKMFPRFYDLDSSCGLDNGGSQTVPPFAQVSKYWCPEIEEREENLEGINWINNELYTATYKHIKDGKMYKYASPDSKLWNYIFNKYKNEISTLYVNLRNGELSDENLIEHFKSTIIDKISYSQYNKDFINKYLGAPNHQLYMYGNRWTDFKDWLHARLAFCDSLFQYKKAQFKVDLAVVIKPTYMFPAYVGTTPQAGETRWGFGITPAVSAGGTGTIEVFATLADSITTKLEMFDSPAYALADNPPNPEDVYNFSNLTELTLNSSIIPDLSKCVNLRTLTIGSSCKYSGTITVPPSVKTLERIATSSSSSIKIALPQSEDSELEVLKLSNVVFNQDVDLSIYKKLREITFSECTFGGTLTFPRTNLNFTSTDCTFTNITVLEGADIAALELNNQTVGTFNLHGTIRRFDFYNSRLSGESKLLDLSSVNGILRLNLVRSNVETVMVGSSTLANNLILGVLESLLKTFKKNTDANDYIGVNLDIFDGKAVTSIINYKNNNYTTPIAQLLKLEFVDGQYRGSASLNDELTNANIVEIKGLSFGYTLIEEVKCTEFSNNSVILGVAMFTWCKKLRKVISDNNVTFSSDLVFCNCPLLDTLRNVKINKFKAAYACDKLPYSQIESSIDKNATNADFNRFMAQYLGNPLITVDTSKYPTIYGATKMFNMPADRELNAINGVLRKIIISGSFILSPTCTTILYMFNGANNSSKIEVNYTELFDLYDSLTNTMGMFCHCEVKDINMLLNKLSYVLNVSSMYYDATITDLPEFTDNKIELTTSSILNLRSTFYEATFENMSELIIDDFIKNLTSQTIRLECCFYGCQGSNGLIAKINDKLYPNSNALSIYINGFLGASSYNSNKPGVYTKIFGLTSPLKIENTLFDYGPRGDDSRTSQSRRGPFSFRSTTVPSITLSGNLESYLYGVHGDDSTGLDITIENPTLLNYFCKNAANINIDSISSTSPFNAIEAFRECTFFNTTGLPTDILKNVRSAERMFAGSNLEKITFLLTDTITSVVSMFNLCRILKGGLPVITLTDPETGDPIIDSETGEVKTKDFYSDLSRDVFNFTKIFYGTRIVVVPTSYDGMTKFLPNWARSAEGAFAAIYNPIGSGEKNLEITIDCPLLTKMKGFLAASSGVRVNFESLPTSSIDMSYAFTFNNANDYNALDINGIKSKIRYSDAMFARWDNDPTAVIPSGGATIIGSGAWYGWNNEENKPALDSSYFYLAIVAHKQQNTHVSAAF